MKEIIIKVPVKHGDVKINNVQGPAVRKFKKNYNFKEAESHGFEGAEKLDNQLFYKYKFVIIK